MFSTEQEKTLSFEQLPQAVAWLISKVENIETLLQHNSPSEPNSSDKWFNLQELCEYLPDKPARQTVYGWVNQRLIPHHKTGKKLQFLKSEIDAWIQGSKRKTAEELQTDAIHFINSKKGGLR